ncbi:MAG: YdcF family protein [Reyranella sp.]|nr:YdcF family protein [Reyranella sp.]
MNMFYFLKLLAQMALPPASLALGMLIAGVLLLFGLRRLAGVVAALAVAELLVLALPPVSDRLMASLQDQTLVHAKAAPACCYDVIVVLGGGIAPAQPPLVPDPHLTDSADRIWHAARLYRRGVAPRIIVSGGGNTEMSEAEAMRLFLTDLGIPLEAVTLEGASFNTIENIRQVREMVKGARIALITSASHMPRAMRLARIAGLNVASFPTDWAPPDDARFWWQNWVPSLTALSVSSVALVEIMANTFDRRGDSLKL